MLTNGSVTFLPKEEWKRTLGTYVLLLASIENWKQEEDPNTNIAANRGGIFVWCIYPVHKKIVVDLVIQYMLDDTNSHPQTWHKPRYWHLGIIWKSENNYFRNQLALHDLKSRRGEDSNPSSDEDVVGEPMILHTSLLCSWTECYTNEMDRSPEWQVDRGLIAVEISMTAS